MRWTPEQAAEVARRTNTLTDGTAPPSVLAA
ncbi:MAG: hypothetical protein Lokiarch_09580 [Candidatus Lokiarchaeum sp. GC14_75]|nr:MAG: hypothetical protein Lokiarch_09580 [Candidatus Lokiarchaeum sp. GC14_75]